MLFCDPAFSATSAVTGSPQAVSTAERANSRCSVVSLAGGGRPCRQLGLAAVQRCRKLASDDVIVFAMVGLVWGM